MRKSFQYHAIRVSFKSKAISTNCDWGFNWQFLPILVFCNMVALSLTVVFISYWTILTNRCKISNMAIFTNSRSFWYYSGRWNTNHFFISVAYLTIRRKANPGLFTNISCLSKDLEEMMFLMLYLQRIMPALDSIIGEIHSSPLPAQ